MTGGPSFIGLLHQEVDVELKAGQYVRHSKYGWGTVMDYDRHQTLVLFRRVGFKRLQTDSANFAAVGDETPKKKRPS